MPRVGFEPTISVFERRQYMPQTEETTVRIAIGRVLHEQQTEEAF